MSVTTQTNIGLSSLAKELLARDNFVICGHVSPDGDCLGSQLALVRALRLLGKTAVGLLAKDEPIDERLAFLPGADTLIPAARYAGSVDTFVALDVPLRSRMNTAAGHLLDAASFSATIDHHAADERMTQVAYIDPAAASTTLLVWELIALLGIKRDQDIARCCYTGLVTDTGRFQYQNTDAAALRGAAAMLDAGADAALVSRCIFQNRSLASKRLEARVIRRVVFGTEDAYALSWLTRVDFEEVQACKADAEPVIDALRSLRGVRVACVLREQEGSLRGSFRAKDDTDVMAFAKELGGGGHRAAAGFTLGGTLSDGIERVRALLDKALVAQGDNKA